MGLFFLLGAAVPSHSCTCRSLDADSEAQHTSGMCCDEQWESSGSARRVCGSAASLLPPVTRLRVGAVTQRAAAWLCRPYSVCQCCLTCCKQLAVAAHVHTDDLIRQRCVPLPYLHGAAFAATRSLTATHIHYRQRRAHRSQQLLVRRRQRLQQLDGRRAGRGGQQRQRWERVAVQRAVGGCGEQLGGVVAEGEREDGGGVSVASAGGDVADLSRGEVDEADGAASAAQRHVAEGGRRRLGGCFLLWLCGGCGEGVGEGGVVGCEVVAVLEALQQVARGDVPQLQAVVCRDADKVAPARVERAQQRRAVHGGGGEQRAAPLDGRRCERMEECTGQAPTAQEGRDSRLRGCGLAGVRSTQCVDWAGRTEPTSSHSSRLRSPLAPRVSHGRRSRSRRPRAVSLHKLTLTASYRSSTLRCRSRHRRRPSCPSAPSVCLSPLRLTRADIDNARSSALSPTLRFQHACRHCLPASGLLLFFRPRLHLLAVQLHLRPRDQPLSRRRAVAALQPVRVHFRRRAGGSLRPLIACHVQPALLRDRPVRAQRLLARPLPPLRRVHLPRRQPSAALPAAARIHIRTVRSGDRA